jgi:hypothetical protein
MHFFDFFRKKRVSPEYIHSFVAHPKVTREDPAAEDNSIAQPQAIEPSSATDRSLPAASLKPRSVPAPEVDCRAVFEMLRAAADAGDAPAQHLLGLQYLHGAGVIQTTMLAERWLTRAAGAGYSPAQFTLGQLHWDGYFVEKGLWQAKYWLQQSSQQGHRHARDILEKVKDELAERENHKRIPAGSRAQGTQLSSRPSSPSPKRDLGKGHCFSYHEREIHRARSGKSFEFARIGKLRGEENEVFFRLGFEAGRQCLIAAEEWLARSGCSFSPYYTLAHSTDHLVTVAVSIAARRGLTKADSETGMGGLVDGSDPWFDERRAAFISGVRYGIRHRVTSGERL